MISLVGKKLTAGYGGVDIIKDINLEVNEGEIVVIVGPNGAGKSVLLECLMGTFIPNSGSIKRKKNISMGYIPQNFNLEKYCFECVCTII